MKDIALALTPNKVVSRSTLRLIALLWGVAVISFWSLWPTQIVPKPLGVLGAFSGLLDAGLVSDLIMSLWLNIEAIAWSTGISLTLAYLTVLPGTRPFVLMVSKLRFLGLTGLTFLFGLAVTGHALKVWMLVFGMTVFFVTSMAEVIASIPKEQFDHARTLRMSEWRVTLEVVVRGTLDQAIENLRQNAAIGWMMLTMVEGLVRSEGGIGTLMLNENKHFQLEAVFALQLTILVVGLLQDYGIGVLKNVLCPYAALTKERR